MIRASGRIASAFLILAAAAASLETARAQPDQPKDLIVGKWEPTKKNEHEVTFDFKKDGTLKLEVKKLGVTFDGKYKFTKENEMQVELTYKDEVKREIMTVKVTKDELTTKDSKGAETIFRRVN